MVKWSALNGIKINCSKSQAIIITKRRINRCTVPKIVIADKEIPYISKIKNLGLILNETLSWDDHVNEMN